MHQSNETKIYTRAMALPHTPTRLKAYRSNFNATLHNKHISILRRINEEKPHSMRATPTSSTAYLRHASRQSYIIEEIGIYLCGEIIEEITGPRRYATPLDQLVNNI